MKTTLTRLERLGSQSDLKTIFASGRKFNTSGAKIVYLNNNLSFSRFAITIVRKFGNSVERNRAKRIFREFFRLNKHNILKGVDIVIVLYPGNFNNEARESQFFNLLKKAQILK